MIGATGAGSGGPNMGYMFILPLMASSLLGGFLYSLNPTYPWICVLGTTLLQLASIVFFIRDPEEAEKYATCSVGFPETSDDMTGMEPPDFTP